MTKQEEIREGMKRILEADIRKPMTAVNLIEAILQYLHSQGVVIKVDCPECKGDGRIQKFFDRTFSNRCPKCNGYGYVVLESLL